MQKTISIIVPVYNEEKNIPVICGELSGVLSGLHYCYEIVVINDGSSDDSEGVIEHLMKADGRVKEIELSRNFGKEAAMSAGMKYAKGDAVIIIDADLQHPPSLIPQLVERWERGADVVIGLRTGTRGQSLLESFFSHLYYRVINSISEIPIRDGATDFRLVDRRVVDEFNKLTERERISRGLIDWLGFRREFVKFEAAERASGVASYSLLKRAKLAMSSFVAHSFFPLKVSGYLGLLISTVSGVGGLIIFLDMYLFGDMFDLAISVTVQFAILIIFLIGLVLACLGLVALYIGNIQQEVYDRPLYIVRSVKNLN